MGIRATVTENNIRDEIRKVWNKKGWDWDTHTGQAAIRLLPIVSSIMSRELAEFKKMLEALSDNINIAGLSSNRAKDAVMLYNALKRSGMPEEGLGYTVYAFLIGDKNPENYPDFKPIGSKEGKTMDDLFAGTKGEGK